MRWADLQGKRVLVLGTAREGVAVAERLQGHAEIVGVDERDGESARAWRERFGGVAIGSEPPEGDVAIASPGIPPHSPLLTALRERGTPVTTSSALWLADHADRTIGVTGSKGKSTTVSLIHALLVAHGVDAQLGGNIGIPLLSLPPADRYVAEYSSQQACYVDRSPDVVVLTSLFPDHLDWHGSEEAYYRDKLNLAEHGPRVVIANGEDVRLRSRVPADTQFVGPGQRWSVGAAAILRDGEAFFDLGDTALLGRHNATNIALALAAAEAVTTIDRATAAGALKGFRPLEHRLEPISDPSGLTFVDDLLAVTPQATIAALEALGQPERVVLLVGGVDRGVDYAPLAEHLRAHPVAAVIGLPDTGAQIVGEVAPGSYVARDMDDAIARARSVAPANGIVLLSPAAASYGHSAQAHATTTGYRSYEDKAVDFRRAIQATVPPEGEP